MSTFPTRRAEIWALRGARQAVGVVVYVGVMLAAVSADAQSRQNCFFLCQPELKLEPAFTVENLFGRHRTAEVFQGQPIVPVRVEREVVFEAILALDIPTSVPRVGFTVETAFTPFATTDENVFTGFTAPEIQRSAIRDNAPEVELEFNFQWLDPETLGGWVSSHFDVVDKISPAERPADGSHYTHKLNLELDTSVHAFHWVADDNWLHHVELESSLDYVATGLARQGDVVGGELFLDDASAWSLSLVFVLPLAPWP